MNEDPTQFRIRHVERFLRDHLYDVLRFDIYPIEGWAGAPTGWNLPRLYEGLFTWPVCPALIATSVSELFSEEVDDYLLAIVAFVSLCVTHQQLPEDERVAAVRSELNERYPASMSMILNIELGSYTNA